MIDVPKLVKQKEEKQPKEIKDKATFTEPVDKTVPNSKEITIEDITNEQPSKNLLFVSFPSKENANNTPKSIPETEKVQ